MTDLQTIIMTSMTGFIAILLSTLVKALKNYLIAKGGEKAVKVIEILAKNAVHAVEQVAEVKGISGSDKLLEAKLSVIDELNKYNIKVTDEQLTVFIESAVNQMNQAWKE